jgi:hypothetical protein
MRPLMLQLQTRAHAQGLPQVALSGTSAVLVEPQAAARTWVQGGLRVALVVRSFEGAGG